jgi:predicted nucleic acid-binding protein
MIVISNTTPIITLIKVEKLEILKELFGEVYISNGVFKELISNEIFRDEARIIKTSDFIKTINVKNEFAVKLLQKTAGLDLGESESIVLSNELKGDVLIIDEKRGRSVAKSMDLNISGTLGLLLKAKDMGIIDKVRPFLDKIIDANIRISMDLYEEIIKRSREE